MYIQRHMPEVMREEAYNIYFDKAMEKDPDKAWEALWIEVLKTDSKKL